MVINSIIHGSFILSVLFLVFFPFFIETLNDKQYLKVSQHDKYAFMVILITKVLSSYNAKI